MPSSQQDAKRAVGSRIAELVEDGMRVGLGTGSTAAVAIEALGAKIRKEGIRITGVATSFASERLARTHGIPLTTLDDTPILDLVFDGADEVDPHLDVIKGRGAAHTREKIVATQADRYIILVDESKMVDQLGTRFPVPVEVIPMAITPVMAILRKLGAEPELRMGLRKDGPVVTDQGLWVIDAMFEGIEKPAIVDRTLLMTPGVVDHGLFLGMATDVLVGKADGSIDHLTRPR